MRSITYEDALFRATQKSPHSGFGLEGVSFLVPALALMRTNYRESMCLTIRSAHTTALVEIARTKSGSGRYRIDSVSRLRRGMRLPINGPPEKFSCFAI